MIFAEHRFDNWKSHSIGPCRDNRQLPNAPYIQQQHPYCFEDSCLSYNLHEHRIFSQCWEHPAGYSIELLKSERNIKKSKKKYIEVRTDEMPNFEGSCRFENKEAIECRKFNSRMEKGQFRLALPFTHLPHVAKCR